MLRDAFVQDLLNTTLLWLCSIHSPIGEESALCDAISARLNKLDLAAPIRRYSNSIVVPLCRRLTSKSSAHTKNLHVAFVGHLDTVRTENGSAHIADGRCFGAGSSDMKSGLAVMIALAETLKPSDIACDVTLVFYAREEGSYAENELGPVLEQDPELAHVDIAVCMEPSDNRLHLGCMGSLHASVKVEGKTAHSARPWEGKNAIVEAIDVMRDLAIVPPREARIDGLDYKSVLTITQAKDGGRGRNVVPDVFTLNVNLRFAPDTSIEQAKQFLIDKVKGRAQITFVDEAPAAMPNANHALVRALIDSGVRAVEPKRAWTDVARFAARGIVAVNFGPGENAQAHQKNESTSLALVHEGYTIVERWLKKVDNR